MNPLDYMDKGLGAVFAVALLGVCVWVLRFALGVWKTDTEEKRKADTENRMRLVDAQVESYKKHVEATDTSIELTRKISQSIELMATSNDVKITHLRNIDAKTARLHRGFHDALDIAIDMIPDKPQIQNKLRQMKDRVAEQ